MTILQDPIKNAIWHFMNHYAYSDAQFLAERLFAEVGSDDALFLLATSYYRVRKPKIVQVLLEKHSFHQSECKLLYAQACWDLDEYAKAEQALVGGSVKIRCIYNIMSNVQAEFGESACFALSLLGKIYQKTDRTDWAERCLTKSLKLNPFLWTSFEMMCEAGKKPNPDDLFNVSSMQNFPQSKPSYASMYNISINQTPPVNQMRKKKGSVVKVLAPSQVGSNTEHMDTNAISSTIQTPESQLPYTATPPPVSEDKKITSKPTHGEGEHNDADFFRSTPTENNQWDSSVDSYTGQSSERRFTRTQQRISRSLIGPAALSPLTPSFGVMPLIETPSPVWERKVSMTTPSDMAPPPVEANPPVKKMVTRQSRKADTTTTTSKLLFSSENNRREPSNTNISNIESNTPHNNPNPAPIRRSNRIFANSGNSAKENTKKTTKSKSGQPKDILKRNTRIRNKTMASDLPVRDLSEEISKLDSPSEKTKTNTTSVTTSQVFTAQKAAVDGLMKLLCDIGNAYSWLCQYDCRKAAACIESLPPHQRDTSWSLSMLARAYFEMTEYKTASQVFQELRSNYPHYVTGLALYSTTLWHLQDNIALSTLAHDLSQLDAHSAETWCAVGNCFSLRRDNESAVKFFVRAAQLAPRYAYAHTLLGHEYAYSDDNERAIACYRKAIHCDPRHYNAWYGIGSIYYKQENFALAEIHFKKALSINQHSSVLLCHLGIVQHAQKRSSTALSTLASALSLEPRNPLCKFHRASILFATDQHEEALKELLQLKQIVPKESLVYFLIGKTYKVLGENHLAMMNFSWALDLDPKGINNHIKEAINKQQDTSNGAEFMDSADTEEEQDNMQDSDESL
ncbi:cell division cycle protein 27 homolog isoform X2 [Clavelina lepadiformis]|uniref:cell division cycle protein 27 homolog isoform X2 n=1 Tax=Clavelina lepadiformis TaxID=159417 RepID=UPI004042FEE9